MITRGAIIILLFILTCILTSCNKVSSTDNSDPQKTGYVPDEQTAIKVAEAIWLPIYGEQILNERPFHAILQGDTIWIVDGTVHSELGGAVHAEISKKDCRVLKVTHYK